MILRCIGIPNRSVNCFEARSCLLFKYDLAEHTENFVFLPFAHGFRFFQKVTANGNNWVFVKLITKLK